VSVVRFPGVTKTLDELTPEELEEAFNRVVAKLPQMTEEERAARDKQLDEEFYYEDAQEAMDRFWILSCHYRDAVIDKYGSDSAEASAVKDDLAFVLSKLRKLESNIDHPNVKQTVKTLSDIWSEYKGGYYDEKGELHWRNKAIGPEIISTFRRTVDFDL
jgi:hypothetical protein